MSKLHQLIAVEENLKTAAERTLDAAKNLFTTGLVRLTGQTRRYQPLTEDGETFVPEVTHLATTIKGELEGIKKAFGDWMDVSVQKELTNAKTKASVVIGGTTILADMTAPALLNLENKLLRLRQLYEAIPTNDPTEVWTYDEQQGMFVSQEQISYRAKKTMKPVVLYEATTQHPAQVKEVNEDVRVGTWTTVKRSGLLTPSQKAQMLNRIDQLYRAVKSARQEANDQPAETTTVAEKIFGYINSGE